MSEKSKRARRARRGRREHSTDDGDAGVVKEKNEVAGSPRLGLLFIAAGPSTKMRQCDCMCTSGSHDVYSEGLNGGDGKGSQREAGRAGVASCEKRVSGRKRAQTRGYPYIGRGEGRRGGIMNTLGGFKGRKRSGGVEGPVRAGVVPDGSLCNIHTTGDECELNNLFLYLVGLLPWFSF